MEELRITGISHDGRGVARAAGGVVCFVRGGLPGETVLARIVRKKRSFCEAELAEVRAAAPSRIAPDCAAFGRCGGCAWRHAEYAAELEYKRQIVQAAFSRIGGTGVEVDPVLSWSPPDFYRNKVTLTFGVEGARIILGFLAGQSRQAVDISECKIFDRRLRPVVDALEVWANGEAGAENPAGRALVLPFSVRSQPGEAASARGCGRAAESCRVPSASARYGAVRVDVRVGDSGQISVLLRGSALSAGQKKRLGSALARVPGVVCAGVRISDSDKVDIFFGKDGIETSLCGIKLQVSPQAFLQVNHTAAQGLYETALEMAALTPDRVVVDLCCGIGAMTLAAARQCRRVFGAEISPAAVRNAQENACLNGIENAEFFEDDMARAALRLKAEGVTPDAVIVDPPRAGFSPGAAGAIAGLAPARVVYVSCDPATLARDCAAMAAFGYQVTRVRPVDMFARTAHVECVALMSKI